jgi:hypothetical protein
MISAFSSFLFLKKKEISYIITWCWELMVRRNVCMNFQLSCLEPLDLFHKCEYVYKFMCMHFKYEIKISFFAIFIHLRMNMFCEPREAIIIWYFVKTKGKMKIKFVLPRFDTRKKIYVYVLCSLTPPLHPHIHSFHFAFVQVHAIGREWWNKK